MRRLGFGLAAFAAIVLALAALCALGGALFAHFHGGTTYAHAVGWAMWIGGALAALLAAMSGSPSRMAGESRLVVGGRFVLGSDIPLPQTPWILVPAGAAVVALGVLVYDRF